MTEKQIEELVGEKIASQYMLCRKNYYKNVLRVLIGGISTIIIIMAGIVGWSYQPVSDIQVLKIQMKVIEGKLDIMLKNNKNNKIKCKKKSEPAGIIIISERNENVHRFTE